MAERDNAVEVIGVEDETMMLCMIGDTVLFQRPDFYVAAPFVLSRMMKPGKVEKAREDVLPNWF